MKEKVWSALSRIVLLLWALAILFPMFWIVYESFKSNREFFADIWALPEKLQFSNYLRAWDNLNVGRSFLNTLCYVGGSLALGLVVTTLGAYAFTRLKWRGRKFFWTMLMISLFLPGINVLVPQYTIMQSLGLLNKLIGLVLLAGLPMSAFGIMLLGSFMSSIPTALEESAMIDGATLFQIFRKIIVPLSVPGIVTVAIFNFVTLYNDFIGPFIMITDPDKYPISVNMYSANAMMQYKADWVALLAGVVLTILPTIVIYILFQRQIMEGATVGGVKG